MQNSVTLPSIAKTDFLEGGILKYSFYVKELWGIHPRAISQEMLKTSSLDFSSYNYQNE